MAQARAGPTPRLHRGGSAGFAVCGVPASSLYFTVPLRVPRFGAFYAKFVLQDRVPDGVQYKVRTALEVSFTTYHLIYFGKIGNLVLELLL